MALASARIAFLTRSFHPSCSHPSLSIHSMIEGLRPSNRYRHRVPLLEAQQVSNFTKKEWRCFRSNAQSCSCSCWYWESLLIFPEIPVTNMADFLTLCWRKIFNLFQAMRAVLFFDLCFMLLPAETDFFSKERGCKGDALVYWGTGHVEMVLALTAKIVILNKQVPIVQIGIPGLERSWFRNCWSLG